MKKAVVLEIKEEYAAVLTEEGFVQKIPNMAYAVGQEIDLEENAVQKEEGRQSVRNRFAGWYRGVAAAAAVFVVSGSGLYYASENVFAYSTVTVTTDDASFELTLNKKDEVVAVKALDEDSEQTASALNISAMRRKPLADTMDRITEGRDQTEVSVTSKNAERRQRLEEEVAGMLPPAPAPEDLQDTVMPDGTQNAGAPDGESAPGNTQNAGRPQREEGMPGGAQNAGAPESESVPGNTQNAGMPQREEGMPGSAQDAGIPAGEDMLQNGNGQQQGDVPPDVGTAPMQGTEFQKSGFPEPGAGEMNPQNNGLLQGMDQAGGMSPGS